MKRCSICGRPGHRARRRAQGLVCPYASVGQGASAAPASLDAPVASHVVEGTTWTFDSIADVVAASERYPIWGNDSADRASDWNGNVTLAQARAMLAGAGAPELTARIMALAADMAPVGYERPALGTTWGVSGAVVNVAAFVAGEPECMLDFHNPAATQRTLDVWISIGCAGAFAPEQIEARGAAICAMIDTTERGGVRVRVHWDASVKSTDTGVCVSMCGILKDYTAPLDLDLLAFVLAHPGMLRRVVFRLREQMRSLADTCGKGFYGQTIAAQRPVADVVIPPMLPTNRADWGDPLEYVQRLFAEGRA